jgi:bacterioferritin
MGVKEDIVKLLNQALELEHTANIQYLAHAELVDGINSEPIIERIQEIAKDEAEHAKKFRTLIGDFLGGEPSMGMAKPKKAATIKEILETNLADEKEAVDIYTKIMEKIKASKDQLPYEFLKLEHEVRHVIMDEQEHISELKKLLGKK